MTALLAAIVCLIGILPTLISGKVVRATITGVVLFLPVLWAFYVGLPNLAMPLLGEAGWVVILIMTIMVIVSAIIMETGNDGPRIAFPIVGVCIGLVIQLAITFYALPIWHADEYASLIGKVEERVWTQDVQPKDPQHVRLVSVELARYLATKQLGEASGAIGSQFNVSQEHMTLQLINNELWYVAPLDFCSFSAWQSVGSAPGYVMVHGEDPLRQVIVKTGLKMKYMPGSFFGKNLERHLWKKYALKYVLTDYSFEIDETGKEFWVVSAYKPTIGRRGAVIQGVIVIDPETGDDTFYKVSDVPAWVDRVYPKELIKRYISYTGRYHEGWWNSFWANHNITEPGNVNLVYGSDGQAQWVTDLTSDNNRDASLVGLMYTSVRTGKSVRYHAVGCTEAAAVDLVNNKVQYRKLHGKDGVLYNIYGVMTSIIPLLGESHTFQGVAMVDVANMQLAVGDSIDEVLRQYQKIIMLPSGQRLAPEKEHTMKEATGTVERIVSEVGGQETVYYVCLRGIPHLFSGQPNVSPKLRMTQQGDSVIIHYIDSKEDITPIQQFDNLGLNFVQSENQINLEKKVQNRTETVQKENDSRSNRGTVENMSDAEIEQLLKARKQ